MEFKLVQILMIFFIYNSTKYNNSRIYYVVFSQKFCNYDTFNFLKFYILKSVYKDKLPKIWSQENHQFFEKRLKLDPTEYVS